MKKMIITFAAALTFVFFAACGSTKGNQPVDLLTSTTWELSTINSKSINTSQYSRGLPHITFTTDNKVSGNGGCNGFSGAYNLNEEGGINLSQIISTKMACEGSGENEFFMMIDKANMTVITSGKLTLLKDSEEIMTFVPKK